MNSFIETLKQLGPSRLGIMAAMVMGLMLFFVFISMRVSSPDMRLLYEDLSSADSGAIAAALETNEIPYQISPDGTRVTVPETEVGRARMLLAEEGLPNGGSLGYEIFDQQSGFGTTNFVQNVNQLRALQGELSRTISTLDDVRSAKVTLTLPKRELFSRETLKPNASVVLDLRPGRKLNSQQILAIQSLVASAVSELKATDVTVVDTDSNLLAQGGQDEENLMALKAEELKQGLEQRLTQKIENIVGKIVGFNNVSATVTTEVNFDRISTNEELFDPEGQVVRSTQTTEENNLERDAIPQDVSVENNLPGVGGDLLANNQPSLESNRIEEVTNFEISRTIRNTVREVGEINRLSVSVLVDGSYTLNEEGERVYEPRNEEQLQQIETLVKSAVGFDDSRGDIVAVVNQQFEEIDFEAEGFDDSLLLGFERTQLLDLAEVLIVTIMIILVVLLVLQPMVNRLLVAGDGDMEEDLETDLLAAGPVSPALAAPLEDRLRGPDQQEEGSDSMIDIAGVEGKVKASSIKKVEEIIENYPNETVAVIRSWMTQENQ